MVQPAYVQQQPMQVYPSPQAWPPRANPQPQYQYQPPPQTAQQAPPITARGMMADPPKQVVQPLVSAPRLPPVSLPPPEALGVAPAPRGANAPAVWLPGPEAVGVVPATRTPPSTVDWNEAHKRLDRLGSIGLQTGQLKDGRFRVAFRLRTNQPDQEQHIEATAATESEAVALALARAEEWARSSRQ